MTLVLQIVAGVIVGGLLLIVLGYLAIRFFLWRLKRNLKSSLGDLGNLGDLLGGAQMITVDVDLDPADLDDLDDDAKARVADFERLGFVRGPVFHAAAAETYLATFADEARRCWAVVNQSAIGGVHCDVVGRHADGRWVTHMTLKDLGLKPPPGILKTRVPGATPADLVERHLRERPEGEYRPTPVAGIETALRDAVRDEGLLRAWRGGIDEDEVGKTARAVGEDADDGMAAVTSLIARGQAAGVLDNAFRGAFQEQTSMSVAEWEQVEDRLLVVHPLSDNDELATALFEDDADADDTRDADDLLGHGETKVRRFAETNAALPPDRRLRHLGPVEVEAADRVLRAEVFVGRAWDEEDGED